VAASQPEGSDQRAIAELLVRYAGALDRRDWALLESCFTADATVDYGRLGGRQQGYSEIERTVRRALNSLDATQHLVSNFDIQIYGDRATAACQLRAGHYLKGVPDGDVVTVVGSYHDQLVRTDLGWRISHRRLQPAWIEGNPRVFEEAAARSRDAGL
jgi:3-phenylpropionate/cinnamic acid dioxygenase small subunit